MVNKEDINKPTLLIPKQDKRWDVERWLKFLNNDTMLMIEKKNSYEKY